ncbi:hypothetical protein JXZ92_01240 [Mycoplasma sp. CSL10137]|uniref:hypothetical protein n=1 Tax=Mycoplasma sp. CSL10137 TaxID=2813824 RepID=UPI00197B0B39|nr:hypothetical protein [Mycoplasma sp. CSL10137]MBN4083445.1 hypothetical protein [Mycoplasma sp. CSL10137]
MYNVLKKDLWRSFFNNINPLNLDNNVEMRFYILQALFDSNTKDFKYKNSAHLKAFRTNTLKLVRDFQGENAYFKIHSEFIKSVGRDFDGIYGTMGVHKNNYSKMDKERIHNLTLKHPNWYFIPDYESNLLFIISDDNLAIRPLFMSIYISDSKDLKGGTSFYDETQRLLNLVNEKYIQKFMNDQNIEKTREELKKYFEWYKNVGRNNRVWRIWDSPEFQEHEKAWQLKRREEKIQKQKELEAEYGEYWK